MAKPLLLRAGAKLAGLLGRARFALLMERLYIAALLCPALRRMTAARLRRILAFNRAPASPEVLARLIRENAACLAQSQIELMAEAGPNEVLSRVDMALLTELQSLRRAGRGVILATAHLGNQPLCLWALAAAGVPLNVVFVNARPFLWSQRPNLRFFSLGSAAGPCLKALSRNEAVLLYSDLDFFPGGRTADFFGAKARPPHGPARLALAARAPILPIYLIPTAGRCRLECDRPLLISDGVTQESLEEELLRSMEKFISRSPGQWILMRDIWDLEGNDRALRRQLKAVRLAGRLGLG